MTRKRRLAHLTFVLTTLVGPVAVAAGAAGATVPSPAGSATAAPGAQTNDAPTVVPSPSVAKPGTQIYVTGANWPKNIPIQAAMCGNLAANGTADCDTAGAGSGQTTADGTFAIYLIAGRPPKPCPCVVYVNSFATTETAKQLFTLVGAPIGAVQTIDTTRTVSATLRLTGSNPASLIGGAAHRMARLSVTNTSSNPITNPGVTLTAGKGADPTTVLSQPQLGTINPGTTIDYQIPVTFNAPAFGQYTVKAQFAGLDNNVVAKATTSAYPWLLIILTWLLIQPILLGLYKRRPVTELGPEDPFAPALPVLDAPMPIAATPAIDHDPFYGAVPAAAAVGTYTPVGTYLTPRAPSAIIPGYVPVFGVTDLRAYLDPNGASVSSTVAPRIVLGGIVPTVPLPPPPNGAPPPQA